MSKQTFDDFMKRLQQDSSLQGELKARFGRPENGVAAAELAGFAAEKGYPFAVEDVSTELDEAALAGVAGGLTTSYSSFLKFNTYSSSDSLFIKIDGLFDKH